MAIGNPLTRLWDYMLSVAARVTNLEDGTDDDFLGGWNAATNVPALAPGVGVQNKWYQVTVAGTRGITGVSENFQIGDTIRFSPNGNKWVRVPYGGGGVSLVNGKAGVVVLVPADIGAPPTANATFTGITNMSSIMPNTDNGSNIGSATMRFISIFTSFLRSVQDIFSPSDTSRMIINGSDISVAASAATAPGGFIARARNNGVNPGGAEMWSGGSASLTIDVNGVMTVVPPIAGNLVPSTDNTRSIGSATAKFVNVWTRQATIGDDAASNARATINGATATNRLLVFAAGGLTEWMLRGNNTARTGGNTGGNIQIDRYDDAGAYVDTPFAIARDTAQTVFGRPPKVPSYTVGTLPSASVYTQGLAYVSNGTANKRLAISDGTSWRFPDGAIVS